MNRRTIAGIALAFATTVLLAGCESIAGDEARWSRHVGVSPSLSLPDPATIRAGVPFTVEVSTIGDSGCTRTGEVIVRYRAAGTVAELTPYDERVTGGTAACTAAPETHTRSVALHFAAAGPKTLRLIGRAFDGSATVSSYEITVLP